MSVLSSAEGVGKTALAGLLKCPALQTLSYVERFRDAPRDVTDAALFWHAQLRLERLTDVDFFDGEEQLVYGRGWPVTLPSHEELPGEVLGVLMWSAQTDGSWWTELGYVNPKARGQGLYRMLWEACVYQAQQAKVRRVQGGTAWRNKTMQDVMQRLGRAPHSIVYEFEVPDA